ncbi:MAG TPA: hypothetical protein VNI52_07055 [Sphingobacteriaceae bacterium]|nr:hypothetical protein [Sphingobacteriaceae bacterium]
MNGDIEGAEYKDIKTECEVKLTEVNTNRLNAIEVEEIVNGAIRTLSKLDVIYWESAVNPKREIIGSIYPEKFLFQDLKGKWEAVSSTNIGTY